MADDKFRGYRNAIRSFYREVGGRENAERIRREYADLHDRQQSEYEYDLSVDLVKPRAGFVRPAAFRNTSRLLIYVACTDPELYIFADGAKAKARHSYLQGLREWSHEYTIDIVNVKIRLKDRLVLIEIVPIDIFLFEFASSSNPIVTQTVVGGSGFSFPVYKGVTIGTTVMMNNGAISASSIVRKQRRSVNGGIDTSIIGRSYMSSLFDEPVSYRNPVKRFGRTRYPDTLMESFAPGNPHTGIHLRGIQFPLGAGEIEQRQPLSQHTTRDIDFDVPFMRNHNTDNVQEAFIQISADWPRACGVQVVTDAIHGSREFAIYVDAFNQFHVFPTAAIEPLDKVNPYTQNVNTLYVQMVAPTLPSWAYKQSVFLRNYWAGHPANDGHATVDLPEPDWKFNHLGTRCASIFYERIPYSFDTAKFTTGDGLTGTHQFTQAEFDTFAATLGVQGRHQITFAPGYAETRYMVAPGIVEVGISIVLTGSLLQSFTASIDFVREVRRPTTSPFCPLYVGYVWYDVPFGAKVVKDKQGNIIEDERVGKIGQFVSLDMERYAAGTTLADAQSFRMCSIKDLDANTELYTFPAGPIYAVDLKSLSFAMLIWRTATESKSISRKPGDPGTPSMVIVPWETFHFGMWVVIGATPKEILWPRSITSADKATVDTVDFMNLTPFKMRDTIEQLQIDDPTWTLVPLNDPTDWTTGNWGAWRDAWLFSVPHYLGGSHPFPVDFAQIEKRIDVDFAAYFVGTHLFYVPVPKWGWYAYADEISNCACASPDTTFFVHPNGTWCFFNNTTIYIPTGIPGGASGNFVDYLSSFDNDVQRVEHVIFDRVHFEIRTDRRVLGKMDTSFQVLHNKAVAKGKKNKTLEDGIEEITDQSLRASFQSGFYPLPFVGYTDVKWLLLNATWDGQLYTYLEPAIQGGAWHSVASPTPGQGGFIGLTFTMPWSNTPGYYDGAFGYPAIGQFHVRFANPIVLQTVSA